MVVTILMCSLLVFLYNISLFFADKYFSVANDGTFSGPGNRNFTKSDESNILKDEIVSEQLTR